MVFFEKKLKNCLNVRGSAPEPPFASGGWRFRPQTSALSLLLTITALSSSFLALNAFYYLQKEPNKYRKCSVFVSFGPRALGTLATPLYSHTTAAPMQLC